MHKVTHHIKHYIPLIGLMLAVVIGFFLFPFDKNFQFVLAVAGALGYITWGIVHHYLHKDLYLEVVLEYIMVATLGLILMFTVLFRA